MDFNADDPFADMLGKKVVYLAADGRELLAVVIGSEGTRGGRGMRFTIEDMRDIGDGWVIRLPFHLGFSCWPPGWGLMFGVQLNDIGIEWHLGPFAGEAWRDKSWESIEGEER